MIMNTYKVDFVANTITITAAFAKAIQNSLLYQLEVIGWLQKE